VTPVDRTIVPARYGFIVSKEAIEAVQATPTPEQQTRINAYRRAYHAALGFQPHGLHYIPELGGVWLPPPEGDVEREPEGVPLPH
jgi:hypothetical protein